MDPLTTIRLNHTVETTGTNWEFDGTPECPQWLNNNTGHTLLVVAETEVTDCFSLHLSHTMLTDEEWKVAEADFAGELIPLTEWILSAPEEALFDEELASVIVAPFWDTPTPPQKKV
jgi:hypothetical protein